MTRDLVIGVGNEFRRDDSVGLLAVRALANRVSQTVTLLEESGEGTALIDALESADNVVILDAVRSRAEPGTIHRLDAIASNIPSGFFNYSTHAFSVAEAIEMLRTISTLPAHLVVLGIEGGDFSAGTELSKPVEAAFSQYLDAAETEIHNMTMITP